VAQALGIIKLQTPVIDPQTRKVIGQQPKDFNKVFGADTTLADLAEWARKNNSVSVTLVFETEEARDE
jgi:hypothetical protein